MEQVKYEITSEYKKKLQEELDVLFKVRRPEIIEQVRLAREQGDLTENAEYESARQEQGKIETRIKEIQEILDRAQIIKHSNAKKVRMGSIVTVLDLSDNEKATYTIVGEVETDPSNHKISKESPLARALWEKTEEATVEVRGIEHPYKVKILAVE